MPERKVWTLGDADIQIYLEDGNGEIHTENPTSDGLPKGELNTYIPYFTYCFAENLNLSSAMQYKKRGVTGRGKRKIVSASGSFDEATCTINHLFFRKVTEYDVGKIFHPSRWIRIVIPFYKLEYTNVAPYENDTFIITCAKATKFDISANMPDVVVANATFVGEVIYGSDTFTIPNQLQQLIAATGGFTGPTGP